MSITKEIALAGVSASKGKALNVPMHQISEMNIVDEFIDISALESINASTNLIEELEDYLKGCTNLRVLDYSLNKLTRIANLGQCRSLVYLNLSQNQITSIQGLNHLTSLSVLDLSMNFIEKLENLEGLSELEQLILYGNRIALLENLDGMSALKVLQVNNNRLLSISELALYNLNSLEVLNAADNIIDVEEMDNCVKTVMSLDSLKDLSLYGNLIADEPTYRFKFADHTKLAKLDGLELKPTIKQKLRDLKKDYEIDTLVEQTKEEYFKRIEAERELKIAAANMLKKQQMAISEQYDNFIEHMENDFDGFINYVYDLKKNKEVGKENEVNDIDLYQWRKGLQEKEQERLRLLEEALNGVNSREYTTPSGVLSAKKDLPYTSTIPPPNIIQEIDLSGKGHNYVKTPPKNEPTALKDPLENALKEYSDFKPIAESEIDKQRKIRDDPNLAAEPQQRYEGLSDAMLRDPKIMALSPNLPSVSSGSTPINSQRKEPREEIKETPNSPLPPSYPEGPRGGNGPNMRQVYDEYNNQNPLQAQPMPGEGPNQPPPGQNLPSNEHLPSEMNPSTEKSEKKSKKKKKSKDKKKKKGKKDRPEGGNPEENNGSEKKSKGCSIF